MALCPPSSTISNSTGPDTLCASRSACEAGTSRSCRPVTMKMGQVIFGAASFIESVAAFFNASASLSQWLRTRKASRVSTGSAAQISFHSNGPEMPMHARMRFS